MCGICGIIENNKNCDISLLKKMSSIISHRGPDDKGFFINGNVGLAHRRLSIIDINSGHQPIYNEDKNIVIVFNGEIYNFKSLHKELETLGHTFQTQSDSEVIVHLYEEYGYDCLEHLRGMFAFAIYNKNKNELFIARDRLGQKPLFYSYVNGTFYFASEIKSILQDSRFKKTPNYNAINHYLSYKYVPHNMSAFENIKKLSHSHYLVFKNSKIEIKKYWNNWFSKEKTEGQ